MPNRIDSKALDNGWRAFLTSVHADPWIDHRRFNAPLKSRMVDVFANFVAVRTDFTGADEITIARRFASSLKAFAQSTHLYDRPPSHSNSATMAGAYRLFLDGITWVKAESDASAALIDTLVKAGRIEEANLVARLMHAQGVEDSRIEAAIDQMTAEQLADGPRIHFALFGSDGKSRLRSSITNAEAARAFFEDDLGSHITIDDVVELLDIGSPLMPLSGLVLERLSAGHEPSLFAIRGIYVDPKGQPTSTAYTIQLGIGLTGKPRIIDRTIEIDPAFRRAGFAARSLLALALFAKRHGLPAWQGIATDQGVLTWPHLGVSYNHEQLSVAMGILKGLRYDGTVPGLDLRDVDSESLESIAGLELWEADIASREIFDEWLTAVVGLRHEEIADLTEPIPIGKLALRALTMELYYDTQRLLDHLVEGYFPEHIARSATKHNRSTAGGLAAKGFEEAHRKAKKELEVAQANEQGSFSSVLVESKEAESADVDAATMAVGFEAVSGNEAAEATPETPSGTSGTTPAFTIPSVPRP